MGEILRQEIPNDIGFSTVICKENVDPNILKAKSMNVQKQKEDKTESKVVEKENILASDAEKKEQEFGISDKIENVQETDVWFSSQYAPITLIDIMNDQKSQNILQPNNKENPSSNPNQSRNKNRSIHNFPLPFNKMVGIGNKTNHPNKKLFYIDPPKWPKTRKNNEKIEKLINKLSSSNRNNYRSLNRNEQLKKSELKQQKAERRRLQLREQQNNKWQVVAAKKKQKREALRKQTEKKNSFAKTRIE